MRILIFTEDPGAANFIDWLPTVAESEGLTVRLFAGGHALPYLRERGANPIPATEAPGLEEGETEWRASQNPAPPRSLRQAAEALLAFERPNVVLVGTSENPWTAGLALIEAARQKGIPSIGAVDGPMNAEFRFRGPGSHALAFAPDWIFLPDEGSRERFQEPGFPTERAVACGHPLYDGVREDRKRLEAEGRDAVRQRLFPDLAPEQRLVVFLAELSDGLDPREFRRSPEYTLHGRSAATTGRTEIALEEFLEALKAPGMPPRDALRVVLRLHPKNRPEEFAAYASELDAVSQAGSPRELAFAADLAAGLTSIVLAEAALLGTPVLSLVPRSREQDWLAGAGSAFPCVSTRENLQLELRRLFRNSDSERINQTAKADRCFPAGARRSMLEIIRRIAADAV